MARTTMRIVKEVIHCEGLRKLSQTLQFLLLLWTVLASFLLIALATLLFWFNPTGLVSVILYKKFLKPIAQHQSTHRHKQRPAGEDSGAFHR